MSVTEIIRKENKNEDEPEIRLDEVVQILKSSRWSVIRWAVIFFVLGIVYAFSKQNEYTATVKVMPELKTSAGPGGGLGDLKSLAGLAGVNIGNVNNTSEAIRPDLYPDIVQSVPFSLHLLRQPVTSTETRKPQKLQDYLAEQANSGINGSIDRLFGGQDGGADKTTPPTTVPTLQLTRRQEAFSKQINARINAEMDKKSGIITITSKMPDPVVAATVASQTLNYLTSYVTDYRTGKARQQVEFLSQQVNESRRRYEASEERLSYYRDRNRNLFLNTAKIEEQRLQADYILAQGVYGELSKQLEQARIKVHEESPVFQVLEPAQVPFRKSGPNRTVLIIGFSMVGAILGLCVFLSKKFITPKSRLTI
jgi:uncharacterized protein involved in exopolysaccharide biosynthesis